MPMLTRHTYPCYLVAISRTCTHEKWATTDVFTHTHICPCWLDICIDIDSSLFHGHADEKNDPRQMYLFTHICLSRLVIYIHVHSSLFHGYMHTWKVNNDRCIYSHTYISYRQVNNDTRTCSEMQAHQITWVPLQHTATHCDTLRHTAAHCNTLQHTATHCDTLQNTATHCNTLQHTCSEMQASQITWVALAIDLPTSP